MTNTSIKAAFQQFWSHVIARTGEMITTANSYTDTKVAALETIINNANDSAYQIGGDEPDSGPILWFDTNT